MLVAKPKRGVWERFGCYPPKIRGNPFIESWIQKKEAKTESEGGQVNNSVLDSFLSADIIYFFPFNGIMIFHPVKKALGYRQGAFSWVRYKIVKTYTLYCIQYCIQ